MLLLVLGEVSEISQQECLHYGQYLFLLPLQLIRSTVLVNNPKIVVRTMRIFFSDSVVNHILLDLN